MSTNRLIVTAGLLVAVFALTHVLTWSLSGFFEPLRARATDRLFAARSEYPSLRPGYDGRVVHVVVDDASIEQREDFYVDREDHARLVRNLNDAGVAIQFHDVIFAAPQTEAEDRLLEQATAEAGNVYYGMGVGLSLARTGSTPPVARRAAPPSVDRVHWSLNVEGDAVDLPRPSWYFSTYPGLSAAARGLGFLDVLPDRDGVYRDAFLLARDDDRFFPSMSLRVACDALGVGPENIQVGPGRRITLRGAREPISGEVRDVVIPVDRQGRMVVDYLGAWGTMKSYPFSTVYDASDDRFTLQDLREELEGKIAIVSWLATGAEDIGAVPVDPMFPRAGIHATVINTLLNGQFLRELSVWQMIAWVELPLLVLLLLATLRLSTFPFVGLAFGTGLLYGALAVAAFLWKGLILDIPGPLLLLVHATVVIASQRFHSESKARARLDRELAVARDIQMRTFPLKMPSLEAHEVAGRSEPADETGGDSYDVIPLGDDRLMLLLGDATGHGLGPALSVTQVRSMLRIAMRLGADLDTSLAQVNDQLADDLASNRFVTAFLGILDARSHVVTYHAAGQGPLMHFKAATAEFEWHTSTTTPMGMMEQIVPATSSRIELGPGDILGLITDGLYEYENRSGEQFEQERVEEIFRTQGHEPLERLIDILFESVHAFGRGVPQADDITILLLRRRDDRSG